MIYDVTVLTDSRYLDDSQDPYKHNVYFEDKLVVDSLKNLGLKVTRKAWDDQEFEWSSSRILVFRTTWDYFDRFEEFSEWLSKVSTICTLVNSKDLIHWNIDKHYLKDLDKNDVRIPPTEFIEPNTEITLSELHSKLKWNDTVLKPCISGAARHTYKLNQDNIEDHEAIFQELIKSEAMMLQPFQTRIVSEGEISMMVINGKFTHAILKRAKPGEFRVQDDFGGSVHDYKPSQNEIVFAENAVKACPELPLYARVDMFTDNDGELAVSELELIEPELWFRNFPQAAKQLANAINLKLQS
ncbi:ATP-grasp domain-containing protein [Winogradskyella poriferorum]|uniref:ATP-grasp domain-containing protein n=1 Tax=Winogradskyella poriferorum TaxID=307627 RepID=UPI003D6513EF